MSDAWVTLTIAAIAVVAGGLYLLARRPKPVVFADPREEQLTRKLARAVGCSLEQALPAIRQEVEIAPNQSEETLLKRAAYHYRQELPNESRQVYRDEVPG
jgi:hypothetical protein